MQEKKRKSPTRLNAEDETGQSGAGDPVLHQIIASEIVLLLSVMICTVMIWNNNLNIYGISYFGVTTPTVPIIAIGFVAGGILLILASRKIPGTPPHGLIRMTLRIVSVGLIMLLLTPYTLDTFFNWTHMAMGSMIFIIELYTGGVICFKYQRDRLSKYALAIQFLGGVIAAFSLPDNMLNLMLEGEVVFQLGFILLLNHILRTQPAAEASPLSPRANG